MPLIDRLLKITETADLNDFKSLQYNTLQLYEHCHGNLHTHLSIYYDNSEFTAQIKRVNAIWNELIDKLEAQNRNFLKKDGFFKIFKSEYSNNSEIQNILNEIKL
jgi:hypothetical protein